MVHILNGQTASYIVCHPHRSLSSVFTMITKQIIEYKEVLSTYLRTTSQYKGTLSVLDISYDMLGCGE